MSKRIRFRLLFGPWNVVDRSPHSMRPSLLQQIQKFPAFLRMCLNCLFRLNLIYLLIVNEPNIIKPTKTIHKNAKHIIYWNRLKKSPKHKKWKSGKQGIGVSDDVDKETSNKHLSIKFDEVQTVKSQLSFRWLILFGRYVSLKCRSCLVDTLNTSTYNFICFTHYYRTLSQLMIIY